MNKEEFRKYVIAEAQKYLFSKENEAATKSPKVISENTDNEIDKNASPIVDASDIKRLAEEMKKINKKIDLRNPLISESDDSLVETIMKNSKIGTKGAPLDLEKINKTKHINFQNEGEMDKWNRVIKYDVPSDEERD